METKMTYLGRLDPMAEGLLLVLAGNTKDKEKYLAWDKTYEFEVLWGFESDTYDILGLIKGEGKTPQKLESKMLSLLKKIQSKTTQAYPPYSSRTVSGKSLFMWARENMIEEIDIPEKRIKIFSLDHLNTRLVTGRKILEEVEERIALVTGDFRQEKVLSAWKNALIARPNEYFMISHFRIDVSSGTYIRGLAQEMGKLLGTGALAYSIKRTRVGDYKLIDN